MPTQLKDRETILFIGDSITDCARRERDIPLGVGYVRMFADMLLVREPEKNIHIINRGIGGHTVEDLRSRWHEDVLWHKPDWLCIKIGINDLNRHLCNPAAPFYSPADYRTIYDGLLQQTRATLPDAKILLITPFYISRDHTPGSYRAKVLGILPKYISVVRELATRYQTRFLDLHAAFQSRLDHQHPDAYCAEPVHPNAAGALLIAETVYEALGA